MLLLTGSPTPFSKRTAAQAEGVLRALSLSALPMKRQAFQSLKRLIGFVYFSRKEKGANPTWSALVARSIITFMRWQDRREEQR